MLLCCQWNFGSKWPTHSEGSEFWHSLPCSASTVRDKKSSTTLNKTPTRHQPRFYAAPNFLKIGIKYLNLSSFGQSRVCGVAQYAVLEANGKVNGIGEISNPSPPKPLDQIGCRFKYITTSPKGVDVPNLIKIDSAVAAVRMRQKHDIAWVYFVNISIRSSPRLQAAFLARF